MTDTQQARNDNLLLLLLLDQDIDKQSRLYLALELVTIVLSSRIETHSCSSSHVPFFGHRMRRVTAVQWWRKRNIKSKVYRKLGALSPFNRLIRQHPLFLLCPPGHAHILIHPSAKLGNHPRRNLFLPHSAPTLSLLSSILCLPGAQHCSPCLDRAVKKMHRLGPYHSHLVAERHK